MQFTAKARYIRFSPYKLRPLVAIIRGKGADYALQWLSTCSLKRVRPLRKLLDSALANAQNRSNLGATELTVKEFRVDQGPTLKYYKPGAKGRPDVQRRKFSHLSVILASKAARTNNVTKNKEE